MLLLGIITLVITIPLASFYLLTILIHRFILLIFLFTTFLSIYSVEILEGLFQITILSQSLNIFILNLSGIFSALKSEKFNLFLFTPSFQNLNTFSLLFYLIFIKNYFLYKSINYNPDFRNFNSNSNKEKFKDYWLNIKPISEWYPLDKNGNSIDYTKKYKNIHEIYILRLIKEPWKCYVDNAESLSKRLLTHK